MAGKMKNEDIKKHEDVDEAKEQSAPGKDSVETPADSRDAEASCLEDAGNVDEQASVEVIEPETAESHAELLEKKEQELEAKEQELEAKEQELQEQKNDYMRLLADFKNYRNRLEKQKSEVVKYANEKLIVDLLSVVDNLERAISHTGEADSVENLSEGLEHVRRQFLDVLQKVGVSQIEAVGKQFNPEMHEALMQMEDGNRQDNEVAQEISKGYLLNNRVIRHSKVAVVKTKNDTAKQ